MIDMDDVREWIEEHTIVHEFIQYRGAAITTPLDKHLAINLNTEEDYENMGAFKLEYECELCRYRTSSTQAYTRHAKKHMREY